MCKKASYLNNSYSTVCDTQLLVCNRYFVLKLHRMIMFCVAHILSGAEQRVGSGVLLKCTAAFLGALTRMAMIISGSHDAAVPSGIKP